MARCAFAVTAALCCCCRCAGMCVLQAACPRPPLRLPSARARPTGAARPSLDAQRLSNHPACLAIVFPHRGGQVPAQGRLPGGAGAAAAGPRLHQQPGGGAAGPVVRSRCGVRVCSPAPRLPPCRSTSLAPLAHAAMCPGWACRCLLLPLTSCTARSHMPPLLCPPPPAGDMHGLPDDGYPSVLQPGFAPFAFMLRRYVPWSDERLRWGRVAGRIGVLQVLRGHGRLASFQG